MIEFKYCKLIKTGSKWIHISSASNKYATNIKIARDDSIDFKDGDTLYLEHIGKSYFKFVDDDNKILEYRDKEINRYWNNVSSKKYIDKFLMTYVDFKKDYLLNGNLKTQKTICLIDEWIVDVYPNYFIGGIRKGDFKRIMGNMDPVEKIRKANLEREFREKRLANEKKKKEEKEALKQFFDTILQNVNRGKRV